MSLSDFSISSPRKSKYGEKSLTNDEDFENFLNDETSESELSNKFKKQQQQQKKPWWMGDDDEKLIKSSAGLDSTKSFIKKPKPEIPKLATTQESHEYDEKHEDTARSLKTLSNRYSEEFDEENSRKSSLTRSRKSFDKNESFVEDESSEQPSSSRKSQPSIIQRKLDTDKKEPVLEGTTPNLLSKVMFIDSLESGALGTQTLRQFQDNKKNETIDQSKLNTQTRRDLADLEMVYRNFTTLTDSGLNTLIKPGTTSTEKSREEEQEEDEDNEEEQKQRRESFLDSKNSENNSELGLQAIKIVKEELEKRVLKQVLDEFNIKKDSQNEKTTESYEWPPNKYKHIKGTGYGTTWKSKPNRKSEINESTVTLKPKYTSSFNSKNFESSFKNESFDVNFEKNNQIIKNLQNQLIQCVDDNERKIKEIRSDYEKKLIDLRAKLVDVTNQYNEKFTENYKKKVTFEEDENSDDEKSKLIKSLEEKISVLEKSLSEQEGLMKGYQLENERLYNEMKKLKENTHKQVSKIVEEKQQLKLDLIQERLQIEKDLNNPKSEEIKVEKSLENVSKKILPIKEESGFDPEIDKKLKQLAQENTELRTRVEFYEKNQHQIESDVKIIEQKNKEIKQLNDRIQKMEMGKSGPDFIREIGRLKKQLNEMDLVIKRLRQSKKNVSNPINLSIDYYEKRIEELEIKLKDKTYDLERQNRMWNQKLFLYKKLRDQESGIETRERDLSPMLKKMDKENYEKIKNLEQLNENLKNLLKNFEKQIVDKQEEIEKLKSGNRLIEKKAYEPQEFAPKQVHSELSYDIDSIKKVYTELENVKLKLCKKENEQKLNEKDYEHKIEQLKNLSSKRIEDLNRKHKNELEHLITVFTGSKIVLSGPDEDSIFDDPIRLRLIIEATKRNQENDSKMLKLAQMNRALSQKCAYLESIHENLSKQSDIGSFSESDDMNSLVKYYENQLQVKNNEIEKFRKELDTMLKLLQTLKI